LKDESVVKKHIERFSSLRDFNAPVQSQHADIDLSAQRPKLKVDADISFRVAPNGLSTVNLMAANLDSSVARNSIKETVGDDDKDDDEEVVPFDEDKVGGMASFIPSSAHVVVFGM
jgi:hypothetical protein